MDQFLATILLWPCNFAPNGWAFCAGQILPIAQNTALFSLIGTFYGGNGTTTFQLPDFRSRVPIGVGQGLGLSPYELGQIGGTESVTLLTNNLPTHSHTFTVSANSTNATDSTPKAGYSLAAPYDSVNFLSIGGYVNAAPDTQLNIGTGTTSTVGNNIPVGITQPYLAVNYIIALTGIFPSRG
jgi:microcystin-dependent protein